MAPASLTERLLRPARVLLDSETIAVATRELLTSDLRALPVVDSSERFCGVFGEREFLAALFPGYLGELRSAAFVTAALDETIGRRAGCASDPVRGHLTTDHVDVPPGASDLEVAETFLHHRVLILPVVQDGAVTGVIDRRDFFAALADAFLASTPAAGA